MGFLFHRYCGALYFIVPYLVFTMLFLNYTAVDVRKMRLTKMDFWILLFQTLSCLLLYFMGVALHWNVGISEGLLITIITPVAASVIVISCALGANRERVTTATIIGNMWVAIIAPILFSFIGKHQDMPFFESFSKIFLRITPQIVLPFFTALLLQKFMPKINATIARIKWTSFYIWAFTLTLVLGKTFHDLIISPNPQWHLVWIACLLCVAVCGVQFAVGKYIGSRYGDTMAGGQILGQKNTSFGIWMSVEYMTSPVASLFPAIYSVCQNLFNSYQMFVYAKKNTPET